MRCFGFDTAIIQLPIEAGVAIVGDGAGGSDAKPRVARPSGFPPNVGGEHLYGSCEQRGPSLSQVVTRNISRYSFAAASSSGAWRRAFLWTVFLLALAVFGCARPLQAQTVVMTLTGTVASGTDVTGVFGFPPGTNLAGQNFIAKFYFDTTKGSVVTYCGASNGEFSTTSPGATATIQIGGGSYTIGVGIPQTTTSYSAVIDRCVLPNGAIENFNVSAASVHGAAYTAGGIRPAAPSTWTTNPAWNGPFADNALFGNYFSVQINILVGDFNQSASADLVPTTFAMDSYVVNPVAKELGNAGNSKSICDCPASATGASSASGPALTNIGVPQVGDPIAPGTGNVFEQITDYTTAGQNPLQFIRYYNSMGNATGLNSLAVMLGENWRSNFDRYLQIGATTVVAERPDGQELGFTLSGSTWVSDSDVDVTLTSSGSTWTLTDHGDTDEVYDAVAPPAGSPLVNVGQLASIRYRNGYTQTLTYSGSQLASVTDSYGRTLSFTYSGNYLSTVITPDTPELTYGFTAAVGGTDVLTSVSYNTSPVTKQVYGYADLQYPYALTSITNEDGNTYASWTYDSGGRGLSSQLGSGASLTSVAYSSNGTTSVSNALGVVDTYTFSTLQNVAKVTQISRAATQSTPAATESFAYDTNGYLSSFTDWNGNQTTYVNDAHGDPTTINEAVGSSAARTTTIAYDSTWVHEPASATTAGLTTSYTYDSSGELLTRKLTDTTTTPVPYSTSGQDRTWANTWSNFLLASTKTPNGNTTQYAYDSSGALTSVTDPLNQVMKITSHTGGGLPLTVVDHNGVTATLTYVPRLRLTSSTVSGTTGTYTTTRSYDAAGNLLTTTLPDNSTLTNAYDNARRFIKVTDALGNYTSYTLDALGDRTSTNIYRSGGTLTWQWSGTFDALGHLLVGTAGAGQTTTRTFDANGNVLTVNDSLGQTTTNTYDALNRLSTSTDANSGVTTFAYDAHDGVVSVTDANGDATTYARDGFGDVIQQTSPDSGTAVFHYDADANLTSKTDALGIVTNQTFDALGRPLTTTYPADSAENVAYTYDQTGTGFAFGVGRLTSVTDAAGSLTRSYEERGNLINETRVSGNVLSTSYSYDGANRVASITHPDGALVTYQRDAAGYVSGVSAQPAGATSATGIAMVAHLPFGPENTVTYGNGIAETVAHDADYRTTNITDTLSGTNLQNLTYVLDRADNVTSTTDAVNPSNSQTLVYDGLNRLTSATSGTDGYGAFNWTYDKVGNRLTQVQGSTTTTYGYTTGTNRLATITSGDPTAMLRLPPLSNGGSGPGAATATSSPSVAPVLQGPSSQATGSSPVAHMPVFSPIIRDYPSARMESISYPAAGAAIYGPESGSSSTHSGTTGTAPVTASQGIGSCTNPNPNPNPNPASFAAVGDFNNDCRSDLLWRNTSTEQVYLWMMNGTTFTSTGSPGSPTSDWVIQGVGDFDGDGKADILWRNSTTGQVYIWLMNGAVLTGSGSLGYVSSDWSIQGIDDFNGEGKADILWRNSTTGHVYIWLMNGSTLTSSGSPGSPTADWSIQGVGEFDGDGKSDILWRNRTTGQVYIWFMNGTTMASNLSVSYVSSDWAIQGAGDYNGDGKADILWRNSTTGQVYIWLMNGTTIASQGSPATPGSVWQVINCDVIDLPQAATATFTPVAGAYSSTQMVTISDTTVGARIYYTTDGTTPTTNSTAYTSPLSVAVSETIEAIAVASGYTTSPAAAAAYTINGGGGGSTVNVTTNANGNITSIPPANGTASAQFTYNNANRLASVTGTPVAPSYVYDWAGRRFSKTDNGASAVVYSYDLDGTLLSENDNGTTTDYIYADGRPIAILQPGNAITANQVNYVIADHLGTPQVVTNSGGAVVWSTTYQPFGTTGLVDASITQNLRLPGQYYDAETGFSYNFARDYMPNLGRYVETDPDGLNGGVDTYEYALSEPLGWTDRKGLSLSELDGGFHTVQDTYDVAQGVIHGFADQQFPYPPGFVMPPNFGGIAEQTAYLLKEAYHALFPPPCLSPEERAVEALKNGGSAFNFVLSSDHTPSVVSNK